MKKLLVLIFLIFAFGVKAQTVTAPIDSTANYHIKMWAQGATPGYLALNQNSKIIDSAIYKQHTKIQALQNTEINGRKLQDGNITIDKASLGIDTTNYGTTNAGALLTGTLLDARLSSNVPLKNARNQFANRQTFDSVAIFSRGATVTGDVTVSGTITGTLSGDGSSITGLNASSLTTGTIPSSRISGYLPQSDSSRFALKTTVIGGNNVYVPLSGTGNVVTITKAMVGVDTLQYFNASNMNTGTLKAGRVSDSVWKVSNLDTADYFNYYHPDTNYVNVNDFKPGDVIQVTTNGADKVYSSVNLGEKSMATNNIPLDSGAIFSRTISSGTSTTFTMNGFSGSGRGKAFSVVIYNSTGSTHTLAWTNPSSYTIVWANGTTPTTIASAKRDVYTFIISGTTIFGSVVQNFNP